MIVYNTTFHAHNDAVERFLEWLRAEYIPRATVDGRLSEPRLTLVRAWYEDVGDNLVEEMAKRFGHQVAGFSTLLEEVDL